MTDFLYDMSANVLNLSDAVRPAPVSMFEPQARELQGLFFVEEEESGGLQERNSMPSRMPALEQPTLSLPTTIVQNIVHPESRFVVRERAQDDAPRELREPVLRREETSIHQQPTGTIESEVIEQLTERRIEHVREIHFRELQPVEIRRMHLQERVLPADPENGGVPASAKIEHTGLSDHVSLLLPREQTMISNPIQFIHAPVKPIATVRHEPQLQQKKRIGNTRPVRQAPAVRVTIGRLEVRALVQSSPSQSTFRRPSGPALTLEDYLKEPRRKL